MEKFLNTVSALNDETRIRLLRFIDKNGATCVCELQNAFDMIQSRLSRHLKILKDAGFLQVERKGTWAYYFISHSLNQFQTDSLNWIKTLDIKLPSIRQADKCGV